MGKFVQKVHNLAIEAEQDEKKIVGKHRRDEGVHIKAVRAAHNTSKHAIHVVALTWAGMPAILAFEAARPWWEKYVESNLTHMVGSEHVEAIHTVSNHFLG